MDGPDTGRLRGSIVIEPGPLFAAGYHLDEQARHWWQPDRALRECHYRLRKAGHPMAGAPMST